VKGDDAKAPVAALTVSAPSAASASSDAPPAVNHEAEVSDGQASDAIEPTANGGAATLSPGQASESSSAADASDTRSSEALAASPKEAVSKATDLAKAAVAAALAHVPEGNPSEWEAVYLADGWPFFHHIASGKVSWVPPKGFVCAPVDAALPAGWVEYRTEQGIPYYHMTRQRADGTVETKTTWGRPSS
jgi:hypothetical protein